MTTKKDDKKLEDFDDVLVRVGDFGKYQKFLIAAIMIPTSFFVSFEVNVILFQSVVPEKYWCDPPGRNLTNLTQEEWWNLTVPKKENQDFEKCLQYDFEVDETFNHSYAIIRKSNNTKECSLRWAYDPSTIQKSIATSNNYYCDKELYSTHLFSIQTLGAIVGTLLLPVIVDKYTGRKLMFFVVCGIHVIFHVLFLFVPYFGLLMFVRFCEGIPFQTDYQMPLIIGLELMSPDKRAMASFFSFVAWTSGMCFAAFIAWIFSNWVYIQILMAVIFLFFFAYWRVMPKSPRWLLSKGRIDECAEILMKIAKVNGKNVDRETLMTELKCVKCDDVHEFDFQMVLKHKRILIHGILLIGYAITMYTVYGTVLINVNVFPENIYLSFFVLSIFEIPSNILSYLSCHYLGRRFTAVITSIFSVICICIAPFLLEARMYLLMLMCILKIFSAQGVYIVCLMTCEIFPTPMRSIGVGTVTVFGMVGLFVSKYIVEIGKDSALQYWIMAGIEVMSLIFAVTIPETIGLPLPQTFEEANNLGKNQPFFKWIHHWNKHKFVEKKNDELRS